MAKSGPINITFRVLIADAAVAVQAPAFDVPQGANVYIRAINGSDAGNAKPIYVGRRPDQVLSKSAGKHNTPVAPNTQIGWPCSNTSEICIAGAVADGAQISIQG